LVELDLLDSIIPGLSWGKDQTADWNRLLVDSSGLPISKTGKDSIEELNWLVLFHKFEPVQLENACLRLKVPTGISGILKAARKLELLLLELPDLPIVEVVKLLDGIPDVSLRAVLAFNSGSSGADIIQQYLSTWKNVKPTITGHVLEKMGIPRGPRYRTILDALRAAWLSGAITDPSTEEAFLKNLISRYE
jgi:hypothetical protein